MTARRTPPRRCPSCGVALSRGLACRNPGCADGRTTPAPALLAGGLHLHEARVPAKAIADVMDTAQGHVRGLSYRIEPSTEHATAADGSRVRLLAVHVEGSRVGYAADLATALAMVAQHAGAERVEVAGSASHAVLVEEVARLRAVERELREALAVSERDASSAMESRGALRIDRDRLRAEVERLTEERDAKLSTLRHIAASAHRALKSQNTGAWKAFLRGVALDADEATR